jgi:putative FmdB family regulatory protein
MPLYEYECSTCGHHFEVIRKFSDPPEEKCPKCGGAVRKLQSAPAFQFKGTGWYVTDYAKSGQSESKEGKAAADAKKDTATETSSKSESSTSGSSTTSSSSSTSPSSTPAASGTTTSKTGD